MQFQLILESNTPAIIGLNYQYPLSAAIYRIIRTFKTTILELKSVIG
ncbi:hypothetical protein [Hydrotalea flava]|nr:hypothetical protein [Hydrotalea flava]